MEEDPKKLGGVLSLVFGFIIIGYFLSIFIPVLFDFFGKGIYIFLALISLALGYSSVELVKEVSGNMHLYAFTGIVASIGFTVGAGAFEGIKLVLKKIPHQMLFMETNFSLTILIFTMGFAIPSVYKLVKEREIDYDALLWYAFGTSFHVFLLFITTVMGLVGFLLP